MLLLQTGSIAKETFTRIKLETDVGLAPLIDVFANPAMKRITTRERLWMALQFSEVKRVYLNACEVRRCCLKPSNDNSSVETDDFFPQARRADWKKLWQLQQRR